MEKVDEYPRIYPLLDEGQPVSGVDYRLTQVAHLRDQLKAEVDTRMALYKKYCRAVNALDGIDTGATVTGIVLGGVGTGLVATIVAAPAVPVILGIAAGCGLFSAGTKIATRRLRLKARKHDQVRALAESKLNSITNLVSKALEDGAISHDEFQTVVGEVRKYYNMKEEIRLGAQKKSLQLDEVTKNELIERGRKEARHSFLKKIGPVGNSP